MEKRCSAVRVTKEGGSDLGEKDLCKSDLGFAKHGLRGPLVDQDLCKFTQICVNLHIFFPPKHKNMCKCANAICDLCFRSAPLWYRR